MASRLWGRIDCDRQLISRLYVRNRCPVVIAEFWIDEAFFVVSPTFEVTAYRTLWFGLQYDSETVEQGETVGNGALATVRWYDGEPVGDGHLQGQFAALKDVVGDMLDKGVFTPSTARQYLKRKLAERVGDRQELLIPTEESPFETASLGKP